MGIIFAVGIGPGSDNMMTVEARETLESCDTIVGYPLYIELLPESLKKKKLLSTPMRAEKERCQMAIDEAKDNKRVAVVCSGDAGIYGMASLLYEMCEENADADIVTVPGITAAVSGASKLGSPLTNDFCVISLSDALTPWDIIEKRLRGACAGDFAIAIYNPQSKKRKDYMKRAAEILYECGVEKTRPSGYVKNIGREGQEVFAGSLSEIIEADIDMFTTVFVGNSQTRIINGRLVTPRGYDI